MLQPNRLISQNVVNLYREPDSASEVISQAVMGAPIEAVKSVDRFTEIRTEDRYKGWVLSRWVVEPEDTSDFFHTTIAPLFADIHSEPNGHSNLVTRLTAGTRVVLDRATATGDFAALLLPSGAAGYTHVGNLSVTYEAMHDPVYSPSEPVAKPEGELNLRTVVMEALMDQLGPVALRLIGTPYLWGGCTPFGIDCSGFTQLVYRLNGILLLRDASLQREDRRFSAVCEGDAMGNAAYAPGDLLFFGKDPEAKISHVGMALGDGSFIHAAGSGRGVIVTWCDEPEFATTYRGARRLSAETDFSIDAA